MGLLVPLIEVLLEEHKFKPITGKVLFIGRQTVFLDAAKHEALLKRHGLANLANSPVEYDQETRGAQGQRLITDRYFMKSLGVDKVDFLDVTDYECADIIHDLGTPIPEKLRDSYDFIYNGGCFDNMFNPGVAIMNLSKMLRPGGRIVCMESASSWKSPYLIYTPGWFYDYYVVNGFLDCKIYLMSYGGRHDDLIYGPWNLYYVNLDANPNGAPPETTHDNHLIVVSIAEKGSTSTCDVQPIQAQYRTKIEWVDDFKAKSAQVKKHPRPLLEAGSQDYHAGDYLWYLGRLQGFPPAGPFRRGTRSFKGRFARFKQLFSRRIRS